MISIAQLIIFFLICITLRTIRSEMLPPIYWNSSNPLFFYDYTLQPRIRDALEFHCPFYETPLRQNQPIERSIIYRVSKFGYENCLLIDEKPVGQCVTPFKETVIKLTMREFTPIPDGLEFTPGQTYYFISTSTALKAGIHNRIGGLCETDKMRLKVYIQADYSRQIDYTDNEAGAVLSNINHLESSLADFISIEEANAKLTIIDDKKDKLHHHPKNIKTRKLINIEQGTQPKKGPRLVQENLILYEIHETDDIYPAPLSSRSICSKDQYAIILGLLFTLLLLSLFVIL